MANSTIVRKVLCGASFSDRSIVSYVHLHGWQDCDVSTMKCQGSYLLLGQCQLLDQQLRNSEYAKCGEQLV